jgi:hypothetical protein
MGWKASNTVDIYQGLGAVKNTNELAGAGHFYGHDDVKSAVFIAGRGVHR